MINGWKPKSKQSAEGDRVVIPVRLRNPPVDNMVEIALKNDLEGYRVVYLGNRCQSSYDVHEALCQSDPSHTNPYPENSSPMEKLKDREFRGNRVDIKGNILLFDSDFESGNLDVAIWRVSTEYDLFLRVDTNTKGHTNWYNFKISNQGFLGKVKLNVMNLRKENSLYGRVKCS